MNKPELKAPAYKSTLRHDNARLDMTGWLRPNSLEVKKLKKFMINIWMNTLTDDAFISKTFFCSCIRWTYVAAVATP